MKVIDLFQGIARGEEVPKHIIVNNSRYYFDCNDSDYYSDNDEEPSLLERVWRHNAYVWLNLEVEIIKEEKEIEKISDKTRYYFRTQNNGMTKTDREALDSMFETIYKTIDEILDELIKIKKEGK